MIDNLTPKEIRAVVAGLDKAGATEDERRIFFDPSLCNPRIDAWIKAIRAGKITLPQGGNSKIWPTFEIPCTD